MHDQYKYTYFWRAGGSPPTLSFYILHPKLKLIIYFRKYHNGLPFWHSAIYHGLAHSHIHVRHMAMQQQQGSNTLHHLKRAPPPSREEQQQIVYPVAIFVLFSNFSYAL
jgi:hypothetical protein